MVTDKAQRIIDYLNAPFHPDWGNPYPISMNWRFSAKENEVLRIKRPDGFRWDGVLLRPDYASKVAPLWWNGILLIYSPSNEIQAKGYYDFFTNQNKSTFTRLGVVSDFPVQAYWDGPKACVKVKENTDVPIRDLAQMLAIRTPR